MAGAKLIIAIALVLVLVLILVFGKPLTGFSVLSFVGLDSQNSTIDKEYAAILEEVLKENPERAARLDDYGRKELERTVLENKELPKEALKSVLKDYLIGLTPTPEEIEQIEQWAEEAKRTGSTAVGGYEESFVIGGKTYTEKELQNMSQEQIEEFIRQKQSEGAEK